MKILIDDYSGHPFQVELSRQLGARGHEVLHLYSSDFVTPKGDLIRHESDPVSFRVEAVSTGKPFTKYDFLKRRSQELKYAALICGHIASFKPDIVVGCNNPLDAQNKIQTFCRARGIPFVFWLQDLYSLAIKTILKAKLSWPGILIGLWYERMEKNLLQSSQHIVPIAEDFLPKLTVWKLREDRITVIKNWAPIAKIVCLDRDNEWRQSHGLDDALVILYTGTIGLKHDPDLILTVAKAFASKQNIRIVVTSEGKYADYLQDQAERHKLTNLHVFPFQHFDHYSEVLAAGDILIAMIEPEAAHYSVPSKILSYLCSGRPIVLAAKQNNLAARTLMCAKAGVVVDPQNHAGFVTAIEAFLADADKRRIAGAHGRLYAEKEFDIHAIADRFEAIFHKCVAIRDA